MRRKGEEEGRRGEGRRGRRMAAWRKREKRGVAAGRKREEEPREREENEREREAAGDGGMVVLRERGG